LVREAFGDGATVVRPGLIVGPGDLTDRFTYWPWRIEKGGEVMAPGKIDDPAQWIDVRDLTEWMVRLGDGTTESHERMQNAVADLWRYTGEMFIADDVDRAAAASGLGVDPSTLESAWRSHVDDVLKRATLTIPETKYMQRGGRDGKHTEHLGHMLSEMQIVARSYPDGKW
jgi:hypothetical protein